MNDEASPTKAETPEILLVEHFEPHVGKLVRFKGTRHTFPLDRIIRDPKEPPSWMKRRAFTLIFRGPKEPDVLPEGFYECEIEAGPTYGLHVAPIHTPQPDRQDYQAIFN